MKCCYNSNPEVVGYIDRMRMKRKRKKNWKEKGMFGIKEQ